MIRLAPFICIILLLNCCASDSLSDKDMYALLSVCQNEFYLQKGVDLEEILTAFEKELIEEGHLLDATGKSFRILFRDLHQEIYFSPPLKKDDFVAAALYENPADLIICAANTFNVDSMLILNLPYTKFTQKINEYLTENENVSVQRLFHFYGHDLQADDFEMPFIRESVLLFLYRWYFNSKYNRDIPIDLDQLSNDILDNN